jgi:hypothetical protein
MKARIMLHKDDLKHLLIHYSNGRAQDKPDLTMKGLLEHQRFVYAHIRK